MAYALFNASFNASFNALGSPPLRCYNAAQRGRRRNMPGISEWMKSV
jgi:hypothetical protein